jgi:outer membrane protein assembly factor BamB
MIKYFEMKPRKRVVLAAFIVLLCLSKGVFCMSTPPQPKVEPPKPVNRFEMPFTDSDWPSFHGNNYRTGFSTEQFIKPPLQVRWGFSTGGNIWSSPSLMAGTLFVGSSDGRLYSLDVTTGTVRWAFKTGNSIFSSPAIDGGTVYFGSSDDLFYAVDADSGNLKWYYETSDPITSSPCVDGGLVYFGSWDGCLYALTTSGTLKWKFKTDAAIYSSPTVARGKVFFGSSDGRVYAVDKETGKLVWYFQTDDYVSGTAAVAGKLIYVGSWDGNMYALGTEDGKLIWKFRTGGGIYSSPAVYEDNVYFGSYDGKLYCLDRIKGMPKWEYASKDSVYHSSPVVANGVVYIGLGYKNKVQAFDAKTGDYIWSYPTGASVGATPAISDTNMYIAASDGKIYAFGDTQPPSAKIDPLKIAYNKYQFTVSWTGEDVGGSGVKSYDIQYRSGNGEAWQNWLTGTTTGSAVFGPNDPIEVKDNTVYYFQARARDHAGNVGNFTGGDGDTYTVIDVTPPRIAKVSINNQQVSQGSFIQSKPLIQASISDNVAVDAESLRVIIDGKEYLPDSFGSGLMKYKHKFPLDPGKHDVKVSAADISGNIADTWEVMGLRVSEGIEAADISVFPVPFNPIAGPVYISYRLNANAETVVFVYDKTGSLIYSLNYSEGKNGGKRGWNKVVWNGITGSNNIVGNGEYTFKIVANKNMVGKGQIIVQK